MYTQLKDVMNVVQENGLLFSGVGVQYIMKLTVRHMNSVPQLWKVGHL